MYICAYLLGVSRVMHAARCPHFYLITVATIAAVAALVAMRRLRRVSRGHTVRVLHTAAAVNATVSRWHRRGRTLGVDVEWVKGSSHPAALLQLSSGDETIIVQLTKLLSAPVVMPERLLRLLADPLVGKAGVGIGQDLCRLEAWAAQLAAAATPANARGFTFAGGIELAPLAKKAGCAGRGLASLCDELLGQTLSKGEVRTSDWEADELSDEQIAYAANDARASLLIWQALQGRLPQPDGRAAPCSPQPRVQRERGGVVAVAVAGLPSATAAATSRESSHRVRIPTRSTPVYDGWLMLDPSGAAMCRMAAKRGRWYVSKGLATQLADDDPLGAAAPGRTIQLRFSPNGPGNAAEPWLLEAKRNVCVGCGCGESSVGGGGAEEACVREGCAGEGRIALGGVEGEGKLVRFSVVPHAFRRHLPAEMKSRDSHDLVVLCVRCYAKLEGPYEAHRRRLFERYGVERHAPRPHGARGGEGVRVRSAALALSQHGAKLPGKRREELEGVVAAALQVAPAALTPALVADLARRPIETATPCAAPRECTAPEELVVRAVAAAAAAGGTDDGSTSCDEESGGGALAAALHAFVCEWRTTFVEALEPRCLPDGWTTEHRRPPHR